MIVHIMKKLTLSILMSLASTGAFSQGIVNFANDTAILTPRPDRLIRFSPFSQLNPFGTNNAPAVGTNYQVQLYYGASTASESSLIAVTAAPASLRPSTTRAPGVWFSGGLRTFENVLPGAVLVLQVRVWDINFGPTYETAYGASLGSGGKSSLFLYTVPQPIDLPHSPMENYVGFLLNPGFVLDVPEPSMAAFTASVLFTWLLLRRQKS